MEGKYTVIDIVVMHPAKGCSSMVADVARVIALLGKREGPRLG